MSSATDNSTGASSRGGMTLNIRMSTSARFTVGGSTSSATITPQTTVLQVKRLISAESASGNCEVGRQRLIYKGRILSDDERTLSDYGVVGDNQTLHLVKGSAPSGANNNAGGAAAQTSQTSPVAPPPMAGAPGSAGANSAGGSNPFLAMQQMMQSQQQMGGAGGMPDMAQMQRQLQENPEMMSSIMNSPMMQNLMSNPDFMRNMMENNPQMRQVLDSNPELRHVLNDPNLMRRSMEMMRDPSAMQNMMRNQDLAMSQIENVPGGFNALRRMYDEVQEPMMDAMAGGGTEASSFGSGNGTGGNSAASGAAGAAMPNPWGSPSPTRPGGSASATSGSAASSAPRQQSAQPSINPWGVGAGAGNTPPASANLWAAGGGGAGAAGTGSMPGIPGMPPGMNMEQTLQLLENPAISQMMQQVMSDPAAMQAMMDANPMMRQMRETNPAAAAMLSNPETMRAMMDPNNLRSMMQMQNAMQQLGGQGGIPGFPPTGAMGSGSFAAPRGSAAGGGLDFSSLLGQFQSAATLTGSQSQQRQLPANPEERYRIQLRSLGDMGFDNREANIQALDANHGNVNRAVEWLLENPQHPAAPPASATNDATSSENGGGGSLASSGGGDAAPSSSQGSAPEGGSGDKKND
mmetsp:Transcript_45787/g.139090  ORF Transcript_45787/g.139090 Transcript_45787/m.139090 type:complete len:634 (-) Transcript_45787:399-2300(-)|eukprot:CAMPEP_0113531872 /NCGR_PEP_ID=MMETSP0015_2-20120614/3738_1 /TAXON_ID=2838 /ORGANISM="Odontella" /LENGTH=633 /DNA_ID=CAMNT_0000430757 /DNA_START=132 /DNA_END=2036 /DNA_ORIENTATION=- /assembly_acc=CAM_ASM_000160